ncbi:MAG: 3',5'-cyclic-nucleotide phosphodiesterase [Myxococcaceae bacterium]|nr:3',5'-cyclic-nucleotide phosphodiesterase [Myxococcaceae bacterium]
MRLRQLPSSFDDSGAASARQHLACFVVDGRVALDAGSLAMAATAEERGAIRDVIVTHAHIDHIATLPLFIDDLFTSLERPVQVHALPEVLAVLESDVFNDRVYPRFQLMKNDHGPVLQFVPLRPGVPTAIAHLTVTAARVHHAVPTAGLLLDDGKSAVGYSSDTTATDAFWALLKSAPRLKGVLLESAFPDALADLARKAGHLTPQSFGAEREKLGRPVPVWAVNVKPLFLAEVLRELERLGIPRLAPGAVLEF